MPKKEKVKSAYERQLLALSSGQPDPLKPGRQYSRPTGAPESANVDVTDMTPSERERIGAIHGRAGRELAAEKMTADVEKAKDVALGLTPPKPVLPTPKTLTTAPQSNVLTQPISQQPPEMQSEEFKKEAQRLAVPKGSKAEQTWAGITGVNPQDISTNVINPISNAPALLKTALNYYENIRALTGFGGRDTRQVSELKDNYALAVDEISKEVGFVANGDMSPEVVEQHLLAAYAANAEIERFAKLKGMGNLRYWLGNGKDLQELASNNYRSLQNLFLQLAVAREKASQKQSLQMQQETRAQAIAGYGEGQ